MHVSIHAGCLPKDHKGLPEAFNILIDPRDDRKILHVYKKESLLVGYSITTGDEQQPATE